MIMFASLTLMGQTNYYVSTTGSDSNDGSFGSPFATWQFGINAADTPGDTVFIRGGTYYSIEPISIDPDDAITPTGGIGTYAAPIVVMSYPGEWAILDCEAHCENWSNPWTFYNNAISINNTEYYVFKDFEIQNVHQCESVVDGAISSAYSCNLTFEHIIMHDIGQRGYWIQGGAWNSFDGPDPETPIAPSKWGFGHPDTTMFINCDAYNLCDSISSTPGNAADGWKTVHYDGNVVMWYGCRAWNYTDDAIDPNNISGGLRIIKNCWAMPGYTYTSLGGWDIERNGFKCSGALAGRNPDWSNDSTYLIITNCIAYRANQGFLQLNYTLPTQAEIYNNTAFGCGISYVGFGSTPTYPNSEKYHNNISYEPTSLNAIAQPYHVFIGSNQYTESHNTWTWQTDYPYYTQNSDYILTSDDFASVDTIAIWNELTAPRQADGSLPTITTLALAPTSDLIDGGIDVGLPYNGTAPDLGAFEFGDASVNANFTITPNPALVSQSVLFDASSSTPTDTTTLVSWVWNFGDTNTGSGETTSHSYSSSGNYTVQLIVTDDEANVDTASIVIVVNDPSPGDITTVAQLRDTLALLDGIGGLIELSANSFTDTINIYHSGIEGNPIIIIPAYGYTPVFTDSISITGDYVTMTTLSFSDDITISGGQASTFSYNIITGSGTFTYTKPRRGNKGRDWIIDYNTYNVGSSATWNGRNFGIYQTIYKLDRHSTKP